MSCHHVKAAREGKMGVEGGKGREGEKKEKEKQNFKQLRHTKVVQQHIKLGERFRSDTSS